MEQTVENMTEEESINKQFEEYLDKKLEEANYVPSLELKIKVLEEQLEKEKNEKLYYVAEFENFKKRVSKQIDAEVNRVEEKILSSICTIWDDLKKLENIEELILEENTNERIHRVVDGMKMIRKKAHTKLTNMKLEPIETIGKLFSSDLHEAIYNNNHENIENIITEEVESGWIYNGRVIKHAKVIIN